MQPLTFFPSFHPILTIFPLSPHPLALVGCLCATPVTFLENIYGMVVFLWLVLFCGGAVLPACSGKFRGDYVRLDFLFLVIFICFSVRREWLCCQVLDALFSCYPVKSFQPLLLPVPTACDNSSYPSSYSYILCIAL